MAHEISDDCSNVIAIDGPAASGKGTLARRLAAHFGYAHLDTGKLYRAVALVLLDADTDPADEVRAALAAASLGAADIEGATLADPALAREDIGRAASVVAAQPSVRAALFDLQRKFAAHPPGGAAGAVLDGRDIGTVICPEARVKFFITASLEARAERRHKELLERGEARIHAQILADLAARDRRDGSREIAPTRAAEDAIEIDTTSMGADAVFAAALGAIKAP